MTTYNTSSTTSPDLDGTMVMGTSTTAPTSYTSDTLGAGTIVAGDGSNLNFQVSFGVAPNIETYDIDANSNGTGYEGSANEESGSDGTVDDWAATAVPPPPEED